MVVLGIESSCDESAVAVIDDRGGLLAHRLFSQTALHDQYGGVVPELASRDHVRKLLPLLRETLEEARARPADVDGVAYTAGPGLAGALLQQRLGFQFFILKGGKEQTDVEAFAVLEPKASWNVPSAGKTIVC